MAIILSISKTCGYGFRLRSRACQPKSGWCSLETVDTSTNMDGRSHLEVDDGMALQHMPCYTNCSQQLVGHASCNVSRHHRYTTLIVQHVITRIEFNNIYLLNLQIWYTI